MTIRTRLNALERRVRREGLHRGSSCPACRGIREESRGCIVVDACDLDSLSHCEECDLTLDERGVPIGIYHGGRTWPAKIIALY